MDSTPDEEEEEASSISSRNGGPSSLVIGVDVGTESARAGLFSGQGLLLAVARRPVKTWYTPNGLVEQSSDQIWTAICAAVRELLQEGEVAAEDVTGIGFCATCSMAVIDKAGNPVAVSEQTDPESVRNVIVWMDQRAAEQADRINAISHDVLRHVGSRISPEMQTPKLLWLKERLPSAYAQAAHFFDLADFCTWRATGSTDRSMCTVTCKWTYLGHERSWDDGYFRAVGLGDLAEAQFERIGGTSVREIGSPIGGGLTAKAASELGLAEGTAVGTGLIDAHSGALGSLLGGQEQIAAILGTSVCTLNLTPEPVYIDGVWGPYHGVVWPNLWLNEGGMSAFGSALLHSLRLHPFYGKMKAQFETKAEMLEHIEAKAIEAAGSMGACSTLFGASLHILPGFLGNRSPNADPWATGAVAGLRMDDGSDGEGGLVEWTVATMMGLCCGLNEILVAIEANMDMDGAKFEEIVVCGGMVRNELLLRLVADFTQKRLFIPHCLEPVLLGAALVGAVAGEMFESVREASPQMVGRWRKFGRVVEPQRDEQVRRFVERKYAAFLALKRCERELRRL